MWFPTLAPSLGRAALGHRRPEHVLDIGGAGREHHQAVEAERDTARLGHDRQRREKLLVERVVLAIKPRLFVHLDCEAPALFCGDLLFSGSIGRSDLPGGDPEQMARSLSRVVLAAEDATVVHPGHGPSTTIGRERAGNPFLADLKAAS